MARRNEHGEALPGRVRSTVAIALCVVLTGLALALLLAVLALPGVVPPPPGGPAFYDQFSGLPNFIRPLPFNRIGFQAGCLASPFLVLLTLWIGRGAARRLPAAWLTPEGERRLARALALGIALAFALCVGRLFYYPTWAEFAGTARRLAHGVAHHLSWKGGALAAVAGIALAALLAALRRGAAWTGPATLALLLLAWGFTTPAKFFSARDVADTYPFMIHVDALGHAMIDAANGRHWLIDFSDQYGGYVEFLGPLLRVLPRHVESVSLTFLGLHAAVMLCLVVLARALIVDNALCLVTALGLLFCGNLYLFVFEGGDFIFQFYALRAFFPGLTLCAALLYFRAPTRGRYLLASALAGIASTWNLESGLILWAGWVCGLLFPALCRRDWPRLARHAALQALFPVAAWAAFALRLQLIGHPDWHRLLTYQGIFYATGLGNTPMKVPDLWMIVIGIYLVAMARAAAAFCRKEADGEDAFSAMLLVFGVGMFTYFENRATIGNLIFVSYPAVLLFARWADAALRPDPAAPPRPAWERGWHLPGVAVLAGLAALFTVSLPLVAHHWGAEARQMRGSGSTPFLDNAAFIRSQTRPGEPCFILSRQSGLHHYLSATPDLLSLPSPEEWVLTAHFRTIYAALRNRELPKVFLDDDFFHLSAMRPAILQELRESLAAGYRPAATSPNGQVTLYLPRE